MKTFFKNWKTSLCAIATAVIAALVGHHSIDPTTGIVLSGVVNALGHAAAADGSNIQN